MRGFVMIVIGFCAVFYGLFLVIAVVANWPGTWPGVVIVVLFVAGGGTLIYKGARRFWKREKEISSNP